MYAIIESLCGGDTEREGEGLVTLHLLKRIPGRVELPSAATALG
jgi:hypothetical protein